MSYCHADPQKRLELATMAYLPERTTRRTALKLAGLGTAAVLGAGTGTAQQTDAARVRVVHAVPDAPNVDVLVDETAVLEDVPFRAVSEYLELQPGTYSLAVVPTGEDVENAVIQTDVTLEAQDYTVAAVGQLADNSVEPLPLVDDNSPLLPNSSRARLVHAAPDAPAVDVTTSVDIPQLQDIVDVPDVTVTLTLFDEVSFGEASRYATGPANQYTLDVREATDDNSEPVVTSFDATLEPTTAYTFFAVGYLNPEEAPADEPFGVVAAASPTPAVGQKQPPGTPGSPGEETPTASGEETPTPSGEETPTPPDEETPTPSGEETPTTPGGEGTPTASGEETPTTPGEGPPTTPGGEPPGDTPSGEPPG